MPRRRFATGARGLAVSGETCSDRPGACFLLPRSRRSIGKRFTKSRYKVSAPRIERLAVASTYPEVSTICFSFQVS